MEEEVYINFKNGEAPALNDENLNQLQKLIKNDFEELEQKYNSIRQFTEAEFRSDGKIEITTSSGVYLLWIVTSGSSQKPSILLINIESRGAMQYVGQGELHNVPSYLNGKLTITIKNQYFRYGYIKLY